MDKSFLCRSTRAVAHRHLDGNPSGALSHPRRWRSGFPVAVCHWDCNWYRDIAALGYPQQPSRQPGWNFQHASWAFFPVLPIMIMAARSTLGVSGDVAGLVVASLSFCVFVFFAGRYLRVVRPGTNVAALTLFLFSFPYCFYLSIPYSESVYAAIAIAAFWCLVRQRNGAFSILAAILSATRVTGVLLTPVIACRYLPAIRAAIGHRDLRATAAAIAAALLPVAIAPLGLFLFITYLYLHTGDGLAFIHIQSVWGRSSADPLRAILHGLAQHDLAELRPLVQESQSYNALCAIAGLALAVRVFGIRRYAESWFLAASILIPLTQGLESLPRLALAQPIFMVFLFDLIWSTRCRAAFPTIIAVSIPAQLFLVRLWTKDYAFLR